jgi:hypothetical protein
LDEVIEMGSKLVVGFVVVTVDRHIVIDGWYMLVLRKQNGPPSN